ncbi:Ribosomal protein L11 methyltransferase [Acaryochloris thomasi RCC1774]|uniref:Ribosomal protein L11 methyltransferase n=2 Tax=Acaryochloris TaxID=155977 RepID=A0A2W1JT29_9CYAN|nr:Ribosomal protein L11 methyltransferase [Acaryochloris thomasi RCC1774]
MVRGYLPESQAPDLEQIAAMLRQDVAEMGCGDLTVTWQIVPEEDWAKSWKAHWHPEEIGDRLLIHPAWLPLPDTDRLVVTLNPGVAFGTGAHATTQLCLRALESQSAETLADLGCGSGILSIAAALLGVQRVYGVDTDPLAVDAARESRNLNGIAADRIQFDLGSIEQVIATDQLVDGFVCNILAEVIVQLMPQFRSIVRPGAWGLLSGLLVSQAAMITDALSEHGWQVMEMTQQEDWCCLQIR